VIGVCKEFNNLGLGRFKVIGDIVKVTVDRPLGSYHPKHKDMYYPINYGYIEGIIAPDGEEQDAYILGVNTPVKESTMENELDSMMGFDELGLYYEVHMVGIDGENFNYSVYLEENLADEKLTEINNAITGFLAPYNDKGIYLGYIDVSKNDDKINIYLDLGNTDYEYQDTAIKGILKALNNIQGIKSVIVNEDCGFAF
jgi:hypothetical protein